MESLARYLEGNTMFTRLAHIIITYPRQVFGFSIALLFLAAVSMAFVTADFSPDYALGDSAESSIVDERLADEFGKRDPAVFMVFTSDESITDPTSLQLVDEAVANLPANTPIEVLITPLNSGSPALLGDDGKSVLVIGQVADDVMLAPADLEHITEIVESVAHANGMEVSFSGPGFIDEEINTRIESSLIRAEIVSIPIALVVLLLVFGTLVAAGMPILAGAASIVLAMAVFTIWSSLGFQSVFGINVITMLGLGLGIDYSLFLVKRYRDELHKRSQSEALTITIQTVGKAVFFSGLTVILGLGGTQFFDMPQLRSLGQAGMIVTASTMLFGLTLLPATLMLLGDRINKGRIGRKPVDESGESAFWYGVAHRVMRRPVITLVATMGLLALFAFPLTDIRQDPGGVDMLPESAESRQVFEHIDQNFPLASTEPVYVILESTDPVAIDSIITEINAIDDVVAVSVTGQTEATLLEVLSAGDTLASEPVVKSIRSLSTSQLPLSVGGMAAISVDSSQIVTDGLPIAIAFIFVSAYIVLVFTFGSVLLPIKAMFMSALSISASLGIVVWVFQWGNLEGLFNFTANGAIISMVPILIACILFGLSMDYEVLLLSRIQEEYEATGGNKKSIATGLAHTGQVVSGAATIMVAVFGGFILADITLLKSLGFGLAIAVLLDATIVRGVLVPTTMSLMGRWNWWAPDWLTRIVNRVGVSHTLPQLSDLPVEVAEQHAGGGE